MAERLKAHAWKACIRATVSRVRIPLPPPPIHLYTCLYEVFSLKAVYALTPAPIDALAKPIGDALAASDAVHGLKAGLPPSAELMRMLVGNGKDKYGSSNSANRRRKTTAGRIAFLSTRGRRLGGLRFPDRRPSRKTEISFVKWNSRTGSLDSVNCARNGARSGSANHCRRVCAAPTNNWSRRILANRPHDFL